MLNSSRNSVVPVRISCYVSGSIDIFLTSLQEHVGLQTSIGAFEILCELKYRLYSSGHNQNICGNTAILQNNTANLSLSFSFDFLDSGIGYHLDSIFLRKPLKNFTDFFSQNMLERSTLSLKNSHIQIF